jgi:CBS domain-containing protein
MTIGRIIEGKIGGIVSCEAGATVEEAARLLAEHRIGAMPVFENGRIAGIFSERDLLYCIAKEGEKVLSRRVGEVMTAPAITVEPGTEVLEALSLMTRRRIRHLPVVQHDEVHGFVSIGDLVKHRIELVEAEAEQMREYIRTA